MEDRQHLEAENSLQLTASKENGVLGLQWNTILPESMSFDSCLTAVCMLCVHGVCVCMCVLSCSVISDSLQPHGL